MDDLYDAYATNLIMGTVVVCIVVIAVTAYVMKNASKAVGLVFLILAVFGVVSSMVLIMTLLSP